MPYEPRSQWWGPDDQFAAYLRKSRKDIADEAKGGEDTLARHRLALTDLARQMGIVIAEFYPEVVSGDLIAARPEMQRLLRDVGDGRYAGVFVMEVERLARGDTLDQGIVAQTFKFSDTRIITPVKTYDPADEADEEYFEFGLFMSRREFKTINRRIQRGRIASVHEGKYVGNKPPYGYDRQKLEHEKGWTLVPNAEEAEIVKKIFAWYTEEPDRIGTSAIAKKLRDMGVPTRSGIAWRADTVATILHNQTYAGWVRWGRRAQKRRLGPDGQVLKSRPTSDDFILQRGRHAPLVSQDVFDLAQENLSKKAIVRGGFGVQNPFAGLIVCGTCGHKMIRKAQPGAPVSIICQYPGCQTVSSYLSDVETYVLKALREWVDKYIIYANSEQGSDIDRRIDEKELQITRLNAEISSTEKQLEKAFDLVETGVYTVDQFIARKNRLSEAIKSKQHSADQARDAISGLKKEKFAMREMAPQIEHVLAVYGTSDPAAKNRLLKSVIDRIVYTKSTNMRWNKGANDMQIYVYPKFPK